MSKLLPIKMLVLSLTGQCNFACRYCYASEHNKGIMTAAVACTAVKQVAIHNQGKPFIIQFSGGEPLLNFNTLQSVVELVESENIPCQLQVQTNASLMTEAIAKYLFKHKVGIGISLDGRPNVNDLLRLTKEGKGATNSIIKGAEILRKLGIGCGITCVVSDVNVEQLEGIVDLAYYLGNVRVLGFDLLRGQGRGGNLKPATRKQMEKALERVWQRNEQLSKLVGCKIVLTQAEKAKRLKQEGKRVEPFGHCHAMSGEAAFVDAEGNIYACASFVDDERFYLGNIRQGIIEERVAEVSKLINKGMEFCRQCSDFTQCGGGCLARWYQEDFQERQLYEAECALKIFFSKRS